MATKMPGAIKDDCRLAALARLPEWQRRLGRRRAPVIEGADRSSAAPGCTGLSVPTMGPARRRLQGRRGPADSGRIPDHRAGFQKCGAPEGRKGGLTEHLIPADAEGVREFAAAVVSIWPEFEWRRLLKGEVANLRDFIN